MELFIHSFHHYDLYSTASPSSRITCTISSTYFTHNSSLCVSTITRITYSGLLAVEHISVGTPLLIDILIADRSHTYLDVLPLHCFEQSHVKHDRGNHRIILQTATFLQILTAYMQDVIPMHFHAIFIHSNTAVRIPVFAEKYELTLLYNFSFICHLYTIRKSIYINSFFSHIYIIKIYPIIFYLIIISNNSTAL